MQNMIFETNDYKFRMASLTSDRFDKHICIGHPEMRSNAHAIKETVERPNFVYQSESHENREVFFKKVATSSYPHMYTKVVVQYNESYGEVTSSWFQKDVSGVKKDGLLYVEPKK